MAKTPTKSAEDAERIARAERLKQARKKFGGFTSAAKACARHHWELEAYKAHESGRNGFNSAIGNQYADAFGVSRTWLYLGVGTPTEIPVANDSKTIPIYADVPAGIMMSTEGVARRRDLRGTLTISGLGKGDWAALVVTGNSMNKIAPDGSTIVFNRDETNPVENGFYVFRDPETGEATFKRYGAGNPPKLRPYSYDDFDPIQVEEHLLQIVGRVRKVVVDV